jgi:hypothetical protein
MEDPMTIGGSASPSGGTGPAAPTTAVTGPLAPSPTPGTTLLGVNAAGLGSDVRQGRGEGGYPSPTGVTAPPVPEPDISKGPGIVAGNLDKSGNWQDWVRQAYQRTRGRDPNEQELADWAGYWNDWGAKDPAYFRDRLDHPEKYGGGADGRSGGGGNGFDPNSPFLSTFRDALMKEMGRLQAPITADDPRLSGAIGAHHVTTSRALDDTQRALAEQAYGAQARGGGGIDQAALAMQAQQARERVGGQEADYNATLVNDTENRRQALLQQLLGMGNQLGYQYSALGQNQGQFEDQLGAQWAQWLANYNRDSLLAGLGN